MMPVRMTTKPQQMPERPDGTPVVRRQELRPVAGPEGVDADRRRSLREELKAAEERFPTGVDTPVEAPPADAHAVAEAIGRLGSEATKVLQPVDAQTLRQILPGHVDEQA